MKQPKVSIVLPTYNGEKYIKESIDSILYQSLSDWELIIVDDCSTDITLDIVKNYAKEDDRIKVIHNKKNQGLPRSLNIGFGYSKGNFLTWTSDDNFYLKDALEKMYNYLNTNKNIYMVCAGMEAIDSYGTKIGPFEKYKKNEMFLYNCVGACFMYKRKVLEEVGNYDEEMFLVEDYDYWLRILKQYGFIGYIEEVLYLYRYHKNSLTQMKSKNIQKKLLDLRKKNIDWLLKNLKNNKAYICRIYYEFIEKDEDIIEFEERIFEFLPEIKLDLPKKDNRKKIILFGAGNYGEKALDFLKDKVAYFVDSDTTKIGTYKEGIEIISTKKLLDIYNNYEVVVSVGSEKLWEIIRFLYNNGIKQYCTYQKLIKMDISY